VNIWINFTSPVTRMIFLSDAVDRMIISSFFWTKQRNITDGQRDRQTDRIARAITAVCIASKQAYAKLPKTDTVDAN